MGEGDGSIFKKMKSKNAKKHTFHLGGGTSVRFDMPETCEPEESGEPGEPVQLYPSKLV